MLYQLLKIYARLAIKIYCTRIIINRPGYLDMEGPVLFAANHPNSFLDGVILTTLHHKKVYSLARGDAFRNSKANRLLRKLQLLPVYRTSEGVENLEHNYTTFSACIEAFKQGHLVLIFSEGRCENEWHLRPLKKGTARLTRSAWQQNIPLKVVPLGFNYSSFTTFGKEVHLNFGDVIAPGSISNSEGEGKFHQEFNEKLGSQLSSLVYEIHPKEKEKRKSIFNIGIRKSFWLLLVPALAGFLLHAPFFYLFRAIALLKFRKSGHYDSVLVSLLFLNYPLYLLLLVFLLFPFAGLWSFLIIAIAPLLARATVLVKYQLDI